MKRIYVAGAYSADNVMDVLHNIRKGIEMSYTIFTLGFAPFSPWLDYHFVFEDTHNKLTVEDFYRYSMTWLEVSDGIFVLPGYEKSKGTLVEIERAKELGIPVFYTLEYLLDYDFGK